MLYSSFVEQALRFAAEAHGSQFRKGTAIPYLTHLTGVALILARAGFDDDEVLAAALLHDTVEDAGVTAETIAARFTPRVAALVVAASEVKRDDAGEKRSWQTRKSEHLERLRSEPVEARAIVLADKLHNLGTLLDDVAIDSAVWSRFNSDPEQQAWYYLAVLDAAGEEPSVDRLRSEYRTLLGRLQAGLPKR